MELYTRWQCESLLHCPPHNLLFKQHQPTCIDKSKSWGRGGARLDSFNELHCRTLPSMQDGVIFSGNKTQQKQTGPKHY